jgi:dipeptidase D
VTIVGSPCSFLIVAIEKVTATLRSRAELAGATFSAGDISPGLSPLSSSPLVQPMKDDYHGVSNAFPGMATVHAGLECGHMAAELPGLDAVSSGPTIHEAIRLRNASRLRP